MPVVRACVAVRCVQFDLSTFFHLTKESEVLSGVKLLADLVEDGKVGLSECIDKKVMERLTGYLTIPGLQAAALETLGVLLYVWLRVTKATTKKGKGAAAASTALTSTSAAVTSASTAVVPHKAGAFGHLPASSTLPPQSLDDWLCTPAATALIAHTLPLLRPLSTRHMASYVLLHFCDGAKAATTFIHTPNAIPTLLDVYSSLTDSKDTSMLLELSSIITGISIKPTRDTLPKLLPIAPVLLSKFRANSNPLMTAYICKALGRLCDGQKEIAELVLNANISSYLLFLYWNAVDNERTHHKNDVDDVLFEDIFGLLGLLAFYERPQSQKLLAPLPTFPASAPFSLTSPNEAEEKKACLAVAEKLREEERVRAVTWTGPRRTDAEVYAEQERLVQSYMKAQSAPDLVDIISVVLDLVVPASLASPPLTPSSTDWYYVQCAAWQISMILTNGMAVRDSQHRRQRLINSLVFKKILRAIDVYAATMPSACLCALSQALSYSVLGASTGQIGYLVCEGILHTLLLVVQHPKTSRKCLLCVLHALNAILSMGERDRVPGRRGGGGGDLWGDEDDEEEREDDDVWAEEEDDDYPPHESSDDDYALPESEKRRKGDSGATDDLKRGIRRRRKRERPGDRWDADDGESHAHHHRDANALQSRTNRPRSQVHHQPAVVAAADESPSTALTVVSPPSPASTAVTPAPSHAASGNAACPHCHGCAHCDGPPAYSSTASTSPPVAAPYNGYVVLLRLYFGIDSILSRLELSTSKRTSKEDQSLLSLIRKLLSYFTHTPDWRLHSPFMQRDDAKAAEMDAGPESPPPPPQPSHPIDWTLHSLSSDAAQAVVAVDGSRPVFLRRTLSTAVRKRQRWKEKQTTLASKVQFDRKRRELRFLLTGVRGELPVVFQRAAKKEKEPSTGKETPTPPPVKAAPSASKAQKPSIEELLRGMQEKEKEREKRNGDAEERKRELKERRVRLEKELGYPTPVAAATPAAPAAPVSATPAVASTAADDEVTDVEDSPSPTAVPVDEKAKKLKDKRAKKKAKAKKKSAAAAAALDKARGKSPADSKEETPDDADGPADSAALDETNEEQRREQEELERQRTEAVLATQAQERALAAVQQAEAEAKAQLQAAEAKRAEVERALQAAKEAKEKKEKVARREAEEKARRLQRQADEERERVAREAEAVKAKAREAQRRVEAEKERAEAEKAREEEKRAQAAAAALALASRPIHPCRYAACSLEGRITASQVYVRLVCSAHCHIFFHHRASTDATATSATPASPLSCWELVPSSPTSSDSPTLSSVISASSPCPTPDCDGSILSLTLLRGKDEVVANLIRPPQAAVKKPPPPTESKRERRARRREEERLRFAESAVEEKKEEEGQGRANAKGGFEVLVPAKEKDFLAPVIPRPSLFSPATPADESKERPTAPTSPPSSTAVAAHPPAKKGRQARRTRIDIYLPEAEEAEEEAEAEKEEEAPVRLHSIDVSGSAYGGVVRTVTDGSITSLLYVRAFTADARDDDGESTSQWLMQQCALVAPVYVTRLFAPTAVLVKFETAAVAQRAYAALRSRLFLQFAAEPWYIVAGAEAFDIAHYHNALMQKQMAGESLQPALAQADAFPAAPFADFADAPRAEEAPLYGASPAALVFASPSPPPSRSGLDTAGGGRGGGDDEEGEELDAEHFDFSFLAIGGDDDASAPPPPVRTESQSLSPSADSTRPTGESTASPAQAFASFTSWTSPTADAVSSAWANASPAQAASSQFSALSGIGSVFSPMHLPSPTTVAPLFSPSSPAQKEKAAGAMTPALDPIVSPQLSSSLSFNGATLDGGSAPRPPLSSVSSFFSSSSLFSPPPTSTGASTSSLFQLSSFSMFPSSSSSSSLSASTSAVSVLAPASSSFFSSSAQAPSTGGSRGAPTASDGDDDLDVWNDEKLSSLVLKSDVEEDDDPAIAPVPTHPRHDSIDLQSTDSHNDRDSAESLSQRHYDPDDDYAPPDSPRSSHTPTPPLPPYPTRPYGAASPSPLAPRFLRQWYPPGALPPMPPPPMFNAPAAIPHEAAYPPAYGWNAAAALPPYAPYGYSAGAYGPAYPAAGWYPATAPGYPPAPAYGVMGAMGGAMGGVYMQMGGGRPAPGYAPLRRAGQKTQPGAMPAYMGAATGAEYRGQAGGAAGAQRVEEEGRERARERKGFVVDLEADFPSLASAPAVPSLASPSASSPSAAAAAAQASPTAAGHASAPLSPQGESASAAGAGGEAPSWTGHLATRLAKPSTSPSASAVAASASLAAAHPPAQLLAPGSPSQAALSPSPPLGAEKGRGGQQPQGLHGQWRPPQPPQPLVKEKEAGRVRAELGGGGGDGGRGKKEGKGVGEKSGGGSDRRRSSGKTNGGDGPLQGGGGKGTMGGGGAANGAAATSGEWTEVGAKKKRK